MPFQSLCRQDDRRRLRDPLRIGSARSLSGHSIASLHMFILEIYIWAMVFTTVACVHPRQAGDLAEWACASLAGAIWPVTIVVRLYRAVRREVRRG